jgi:hypothetical protein
LHKLEPEVDNEYETSSFTDEVFMEDMFVVVT